MNARTVSIVAGIFSFLNTIQFCFFELKQPRYIGSDYKYSIYKVTDSDIVSWVLDNRQKVNICLSFTTLLVSGFLLFCIYQNIILGVMIYTLWIITFELSNLSLVLILHGAIKDQFKELSHIYLFMQVSRMLLHFGSLFYVLKHGYDLYMGPQNVSKTLRHRQSSTSTMES